MDEESNKSKLKHGLPRITPQPCAGGPHEGQSNSIMDKESNKSKLKHGLPRTTQQANWNRLGPLISQVAKKTW